MNDAMQSRRSPLLRFPQRTRHRRSPEAEREIAQAREFAHPGAAPVAAPISLAIVHHNEFMREGLALLLAREPDMSVAVPCQDQLAGLREAPVDVVLVSLGSGDAGREGISAFAADSGSKLIILTPTAEPADYALLEQASVYALVLDAATPGELLQTIRSVAAGVRVWPPTTIKALLSRAGAGQPALHSPIQHEDSRMTRREREVISLIADGLSTKEMARKMGVSSFTVRTHVRNIMDKLNLHSRLQLASHVLRQQKERPASLSA